MTDRTIDRTRLPIRRPPFQGVVKRTLDGSEPDWNSIAPTPAPDGEPNVPLVLTDDAGFGNPSGFGGPISTPTFDRLREGGLTPPLLAATAVGAAAGGIMGKFAKHRLESGIGEKMDAALPAGSGGVIAVYDSDGADAVDEALVNAVKKSVAHIDGGSAKELKAGLEEAHAGMGG